MVDLSVKDDCFVRANELVRIKKKLCDERDVMNLKTSECWQKASKAIANQRYEQPPNTYNNRSIKYTHVLIEFQMMTIINTLLFSILEYCRLIRWLQFRCTLFASDLVAP